MTIQGMIKKSFDKNPHKTAFVTENTEIKYSELKEYTDNFISYFENISNEFVVVIMGQKINYAISLIGLLLSRLIFVPCSDDDTNIILTKIKEIHAKNVLIDKFISKELLNELRNLNFSITYIEDVLCNNKTASTKKYLNDDPVYVYFTSGTTGIPKAILGKNCALAHYVYWEINKFNIKHQDKFAQITNVAFDPYLRDILVPICSGAQIVFPIDNFLFSINSFVKWLSRNEITIIHCTPIVLNIIVRYIKDYNTLSSIKWVFLAGEKPIVSDITTCYSNLPNITFVNLYGPTETTMANMFYVIKREKDYDEIPIGKPITEVKVLLMDKNGSSCKDNEIGEIYFVSNYLSLGYLNHNNDSFINSTQYKTGDLAIRTKEGYIIKGRKDRCVKICGIKVNLSEIEKIIEQMFSIKKCVVLFYSQKLYAFILSDKKFSSQKIIFELSKKINKSVIPKQYYYVDRWPITKNGKIDHKNLEKRIQDYIGTKL